MNTVKDIFMWEIVADLRFKVPTHVVYYTGQWDNHIMDWRGMNCRRIKAPDCPRFHTIKEANDWAEKQYNEHYKDHDIDGEGSFTGDNESAFNKRIVAEMGEYHGENTQEDWENLQAECYGGG